MKYGLLIPVLLMFASPAFAGTVTFTDPISCDPTNTVALPVDGRFAFRIVTTPRLPTNIAIASVGITDDTGQMTPTCHPMTDDQEIAVTSEAVTAVQPMITVTARSYSNANCTGGQSVMSNPIQVEFVPGPAGLLGPLVP